MANSPLVKKLQLKPEQRGAIINAPPGYIEALGQLPEGTKLTSKITGTLDFIQLFVKNSAELNRHAPKAIQAIKHDGMLWISYPKGSSKMETDLNRDVIWDLVKKHGLLGVSLVSIDDVWSAMRFRPAEKVGK